MFGQVGVLFAHLPSPFFWLKKHFCVAMCFFLGGGGLIQAIYRRGFADRHPWVRRKREAAASRGRQAPGTGEDVPPGGGPAAPAAQGAPPQTMSAPHRFCPPFHIPANTCAILVLGLFVSGCGPSGSKLYRTKRYVTD